jgi:hypothetical protein
VSVQLLSPQPGTLLEADRTQQFEVLAPSWAAVAVGSPQAGWVKLQPQQGAVLGRDGGEKAASDTPGECLLFEGRVTLPRVSSCYVAVQDARRQLGQGDSSWTSLLGLHIWPPVRHMAGCASLAVPCGKVDFGLAL